MNTATRYLLLFYSFAFLGWCIEVTLKYIQYHRFINRGFLTGPWLPIYGAGAVLITALLNGLSTVGETSYGTTFAVSFVLCGMIEYAASWFMEKRFHARWWDYGRKPMNLNGRVWIGNLILFGIGGVLIYEVIDPALLTLYDNIELYVKEIAAGALSVLFVSDYLMTHFILKLVKAGVEKSEADNTEEIGREIRLLLSDRSIFYRRFADAYPEVVYKTEKIAKRINEIKKETEKLRKEAEKRVSALNDRIDEKKTKIAEAIDPSISVKNKIIKSQNELIDLLYDENTATDHEKELKAEIEKNKNKYNAS